MNKFNAKMIAMMVGFLKKFRTSDANKLIAATVAQNAIEQIELNSEVVDYDTVAEMVIELLEIYHG